MKLLLALPLLLLPACAGLGGGMGGLSAEQITAAAKDKNSSVGCTSYTGTGGQFAAVYVSSDKGVTGTGGGETSLECGSSIKVIVKDAGKVITVTPTAPAAPAAPKVSP